MSETILKWKEGTERRELVLYEDGPAPLVVLYRISVAGKRHVDETWVTNGILSHGN